MTAVLISLLLISMIVAGVTLLRATCKEFDKLGKVWKIMSFVYLGAVLISVAITVAIVILCS